MSPLMLAECGIFAARVRIIRRIICEGEGGVSKGARILGEQEGGRRAVKRLAWVFGSLIAVLEKGGWR